MTLTERLTAARDNYAQQLLDLSNPARRKVSYSIGNRSVSWTEYQTFLKDEIKDIEAHLSAISAADGSGYVVSAIQ